MSTWSVVFYFQMDCAEPVKTLDWQFIYLLSLDLIHGLTESCIYIYYSQFFLVILGRKRNHWFS